MRAQEQKIYISLRCFQSFKTLKSSGWTSRFCWGRAERLSKAHRAQMSEKLRKLLDFETEKGLKLFQNPKVIIIQIDFSKPAKIFASFLPTALRGRASLLEEKFCPLHTLWDTQKTFYLEQNCSSMAHSLVKAQTLYALLYEAKELYFNGAEKEFLAVYLSRSWEIMSYKVWCQFPLYPPARMKSSMSVVTPTRYGISTRLGI